MVSDTFGVWFLSLSQMQCSLSDLINRSHDVTQPRSSCRLMWSTELLAAAAHHAWRSVWLFFLFCDPEPKNACKGSS